MVDTSQVYIAKPSTTTSGPLLRKNISVESRISGNGKAEPAIPHRFSEVEAFS